MEKAKTKTYNECVDVECVSNMNELIFQAEESECLKMFLDDFNVPTECDGEPLSLIGRVMWYKYGCLPSC